MRPGRVARVGISIGYVIYGQEGTAIDELMEIADHRMYADLARMRPLLCRAHGTSPESGAKPEIPERL